MGAGSAVCYNKKVKKEKRTITSQLNSLLEYQRFKHMAYKVILTRPVISVLGGHVIVMRERSISRVVCYLTRKRKTNKTKKFISDFIVIIHSFANTSVVKTPGKDTIHTKPI